MSSVSVRWGRAGAFTLPQGTVAQRGRTLGNSRGRARLSKGTNPVRDLPGAAAGFLPAAGNRRWDFSLPGKTEARCGPTPGTSRVRARRGGEKRHGARLARRKRACVRGFFLLSFAFSCLAFASQNSFHLSLRPRRGFPRLSPPAALFPACMSCRLLLFRGLLRPLPVCLFCVVYASSLLFFCPFLPNFFLSNLFSFVAQAATGLYFLPKRK